MGPKGEEEGSVRHDTTRHSPEEAAAPVQHNNTYMNQQQQLSRKRKPEATIFSWLESVRTLLVDTFWNILTQ
uniref:Uncharacterized protein n=1 Tax=Onchocerca volvulus TaxID=6282 RepID=A0A8R1XZF0_ONCVO